MNLNSRQRSSKRQHQQASAGLFDDTSDHPVASAGTSGVPQQQFYDPSAHAAAAAAAGPAGQGQAAFNYGADPYGSSAYQQSQQATYQPQYPPTSQQQQQQQQQGYQPNFMPSQLLNNPMVNDMAMQYGQQVFGQGSQYVQENLNKYVASSRIKYYFAVDNAYVGKKLLLLLFPYANKNWSLTYSSDEAAAAAAAASSAAPLPVAPRFDSNAPDLYIPAMAFVTYILLCGVALGVRDKFSPELLGVQTSTALVWLLVEILALLLTFYIFNLNSRLRYLDLVAYAGYKYVGMIAIVLSGLFFNSIGFYAALLWCGAALAFFLIRTLNFQIQAADQSSAGHKRRLYMLLFIAGLQPLFMWLLTARVLT